MKLYVAQFYWPEGWQCQFLVPQGHAGVWSVYQSRGFEEVALSLSPPWYQLRVQCLTSRGPFQRSMALIPLLSLGQRDLAPGPQMDTLSILPPPSHLEIRSARQEGLGHFYLQRVAFNILRFPISVPQPGCLDLLWSLEPSTGQFTLIPLTGLKRQSWQ